MGEIVLSSILTSSFFLARSLFSLIVLLNAVLLSGHISSAVAQDRNDLWAALKKPGHFVMMRHAIAPGTGDPDHFRLGDCTTQRNLSESGRQQARRTGEAFRKNGITGAAVYSSEWCRCLETARLLGLGDVEPMPSLNSFFEARSQGPAQTRQLRQEMSKMDLSRPVVLVTHQVNVTAFSGVYPRSGEMVLMRRMPDGEFETMGRLNP
jgi:phosphohistidine phosphatase SixA